MSVPKLTDDDIQVIQRLVGLMSRRTRSKDRLEYDQLSQESHFVVFKRRPGARRRS
jgi:hypothetical protein